jgi:AraC-like DNA-binding protein
MISGRKRVHEGQGRAFDVLPGESLVVPAGQILRVDVPEAATGAPTTYITLTIDREVVQQVRDRLGGTAPRPSSAPHRPQNRPVHFENPASVDRVLGTLVTLFTENPAHRDVLIDLNATELLVRLLQTEARALLLAHSEERPPSHGLAAAITYVHDHLDRHLTAEELAEKACMSRSTFYRSFRSEFGVTPLQYVNRLRMERAQRLLRTADQTVTDVSYDLGFSSVSHFITTFKKYVGVTPKTYQEAYAGLASAG